MATLVAMALFLPFQSQPWSLYVAACAGYSVLVFGLRRVQQGSGASSAENAKPASAILRIHLTFLALVAGWVGLCIALIPHLPYFLRTEDTRRPYFGLAFFGILGLLFMEAVEQRFLRPSLEMDALHSGNNSSQ
jgi:hypothetical protein